MNVGSVSVLRSVSCIIIHSNISSSIRVKALPVQICGSLCLGVQVQHRSTRCSRIVGLYIHSFAVLCGDLWLLFSISKSCVRSIACDHRKPFISKSLSPNSQQWTSSNFDNEIQPGWNAVYIPYFMRNVLKKNSRKFLLPSILGISISHSRDSPHFSTSQLWGTKKGRSLGSPGVKGRENKHGVYVGFFLYGKWQLPNSEMDPKNKLKNNWFDNFQRHSQVSSVVSLKHWHVDLLIIIFTSPRTHSHLANVWNVFSCSGVFLDVNVISCLQVFVLLVVSWLSQPSSEFSLSSFTPLALPRITLHKQTLDLCSKLQYVLDLPPPTNSGKWRSPNKNVLANPDPCGICYWVGGKIQSMHHFNQYPGVPTGHSPFAHETGSLPAKPDAKNMLDWHRLTTSCFFKVWLLQFHHLFGQDRKIHVAPFAHLLWVWERSCQ